jgi:hypothetical protein
LNVRFRGDEVEQGHAINILDVGRRKIVIIGLQVSDVDGLVVEVHANGPTQ